jgi:putative spermidine/putrescine transport system substrate-binding protein
MCPRPACFLRWALFFGLLPLLLAGPPAFGADPLLSAEWPAVVAAARGQTVDWYMWGGSPAVNALVNGYIADQVRERYGITLRQVPVQDIAEVVGKLVIERQAGKTDGGSVDLMWINGENFRTARRNDLLFGPFADRLPHQRLVDWRQPSVNHDFGTPVDGWESPWGSAQVVMIHDSARTPEPPRTVAALLDWIRRHPGRFAYPAPPDFTGSVFVRHVFYHVAGGPSPWQSGYREADFEAAADRTYALLRELAPFLWREGKTYPESPVRLNTLFADGEIDFAFSYHPADASRNVIDGLFPPTVRTFVFDEGTIANTHFVAIPFNAAHRAGAMVVADFLLSPEAQLQKAAPRVWGDLPAIDAARLDPAWQKRFQDTIARGPATLPQAEMEARRLPELPADLLVRLEKGWETRVLKGR